MVNNILFLSLFLILSSCYGDNGCIDADDFGDVEKEKIIVNSSIENNCEIDFDGLARFQSDSTSSSTSTTTASSSTSTTTASSSTSTTTASSSTSTTPTSIYANYVKNPTLIDCLEGKGVYGLTPDPTRKCTNTNVYPDANLKRSCENNCIDRCKGAKEGARWITNTPNASGFGNGVNIRPNSQIFVTITKGNIDLGIKNDTRPIVCSNDKNYPEGFDYITTPSDQCSSSSLANKVKGGSEYDLFLIGLNAHDVQNAPISDVLNDSYRSILYLEKKPNLYENLNDWSCSSSLFSSSQSNIHCYTADNAVNSSDFSKRYHNYGGFLRYANDISSQEVIPSLNSNFLEYTNDSYDAKSMQIKVSSAECAPISFEYLKIFENKEIKSDYDTTIPNLILSLPIFDTTYYPNDISNIITVYPQSKIVLKFSNPASLSDKCKKDIKFKLTNFVDFEVPISGFVQFKILPTLADNSISCSLYGQIINKKGSKGTITKSMEEKKIYYYPTPAPSSGSISLAFSPATYTIGLGNYSNKDKVKIASSKCQSDIQTSSYGSIPYTNFYCENGNGANTSEIGVGAGGGGNLGGQTDQNGSSFANPEFSYSDPVKTNDVNGNGNIELFSCSEKESGCSISLSPKTPGLDFTSTIALPASKIIYYTIKGARGSQSGCEGSTSNNGVNISGSLFLNGWSSNVDIKYKIGKEGVAKTSCSLNLKYGTSTPKTINTFESYGKIDGSSQIKYSKFERSISIMEHNQFCQNYNLSKLFTMFDPTPPNVNKLNSATFLLSSIPRNDVCDSGNARSGQNGPTNNFGGGGAGGGNGLSISGGFINNSSGSTSNQYFHNTAKSGKSYYNPEYHLEKPTFYIDPTPSANGSVKILDSSNTILFDSQTSSSGQYNITNNNMVLNYQICGAKGGDGNHSVQANRTVGAYGSCFRGKILFPKAITLNFVLGSTGANATSNSGAVNSSEILIGGNGGNSSTGSFGGGGAGGGASIINFTEDGVNKILAIAGGGAGGYGGNNLNFNATTPTIANNQVTDLLPYLKINVIDKHDVFLLSKYYTGSRNIDNDIAKFMTYFASSSTLPSIPFSLNQPPSPSSNKYIFSRLIFLSAGNPHIIGNSYIINQKCHDERYPQLAAKLCLNQQSCTIPSISVTTGINNCQNQVELGRSANGTSSGGGGGGGNIIGQGGTVIAGNSGTSYFNSYFHNQQPVSSFQTSITTPQVSITFTPSSSPSAVTLSPSSASTVTIPANTTAINYVLVGGKGANNGSAQGAYGTEISGTITKNFEAGQILSFSTVAGGINGGLGARLEINGTTVAISGGGGSAGSNSAIPNNILSDELNNFPALKKIAIKFEIEKIPTSSSDAYSIEEFNSAVGTSSATINANTGFVIGDIIFANYGTTPTSSTISSQTVYSYSADRSLDAEERLKVLCLGKTTCTFNLNALTLGTTSSSSPSLKVIWVKKKIDTSGSASSNEILAGGISEYEGNGGSASFLAIKRTDEPHDTSNRYDYAVIAGGGAGGNSLNQASNSSDEIEKIVNNNALGLRAIVQTSSPVTTYNGVEYLEYQPNSATFSSAPNFVKTSGIAVNSNLSSTSNNFFVRKGQILRILPQSFINNNYSTRYNGVKQCTVGMVAKITPRPAVFCTQTTESETINNPSCTPDTASGTQTDTANNPCVNPIICTGDTEKNYTLANKSNSSAQGSGSNFFYCSKADCSKITCTYNTATDSHTCNTSAPSCPGSYSEDKSSDPTFAFFENSTSCSNCRNRQSSYMQSLRKKFTITNKYKCYSFEDFNNSAEIFLSNPNRNYLDVKQVEPYQDTNNEVFDFGNISGLKKNTDNYFMLSTPLLFSSDGTLKSFVAPINTKFSSFDLGSPNANTKIIYQISETSTFSNGQQLDISLCKEYSDVTTICRPLSTQEIPSSNLIANVRDQNSANNPYKFESNILVKLRNFSISSLNCANSPSVSSSDFLCYNHDQGNENEIKKHRLAFRIKDIDSDITNNTGSYEVEIKVKNLSKSNVGGIVNSILTPISEKLDGKKDNPATAVNESIESPGITKAFYQALISSAYYQRLLNMCIILSLTFYGMGFLMGVSELKHAEIVKIIFKIGFIFLFTSPSLGLLWFDKYFITLFKNATSFLAYSVAATMDNSSEITNIIATGDYSDPRALFKSVDTVLDLLLAPAVQNKVLALLFSSIFGWIYFVILFYTFLTYFYAIANSVLLYMTCQIVVSVLLILGPLFFIFLIFKITKEMFDNWIKALVGFSLQQIFLVLALAFFNSLVISFLKLALGYRICWTNVLSINIVIKRFSLFNFWTVAGTNSPSTYADNDVESSFGSDSNMPSLVLFLMLMIVVSLMKQFIEFFTNLAVSLAGGIKASSVGGDAAAMGKSIFNGAKGLAGKAAGMTVGRAMANVDNFLFASGSIAKQERQAERQKFMNDVKTRVEATSFANDAVSKFKKENALALSSMSASEQKAQIQNVRNNAIKEYAQDNNIKNIDSIMNSKGLNYSGTNLFGAVAQAGKQSITSGGSLFRSMNERDVKSSMSKNEASEALSKMSKDDQQKFMENVKAGNLHIERGKLENARRIIKSPISTAKTVGKAIADPFKIAGEAGKKAISDDIKTQAIKELKDAGKISELKTGKIDKMVPSALSGWWRSDAEKKLIREKMREIADNKKLSTPVKDVKVTSNSVIRNLETELKYQDKSLSNAVKSTATQFKDVFANTEKRDKKEIKEKQIKRDETYVKEVAKDEIAKVQPVKNELIDKLKNLNDNINSNPQFEKYNQATKLRENLNDGTKISQETKDKIAAGNNNDLKSLVNKIDNLQTREQAVQAQNGKTFLEKAKNFVSPSRNKEKAALAIEKNKLNKELSSIRQSELSQTKGLSEKVEERDKIRGELISSNEKINRLSE